MYKYKVMEDSGGGLTLFVFGADGNIIFAHTGYEYIQGQLTNDIKALKNGDDVTEWDGCADNPQALYNDFAPDMEGVGWDIIADDKGIYPNKMNAAGSEEFGIDI